MTRRVRECHYVNVSGRPEIEGVEVLSETVDHVDCRRCGHGSDVVWLGDGGNPVVTR